MRTIHRLGMSAVALLGLTAVVTPGCKSLENALNDGGLAGNCEADLTAQADSLQTAVTSLTTVSDKMKASLFVACSDIVVKLGGSKPMGPDSGTPTDDEVTTACNSASTSITAALSASGMAKAQLTVVVEGGQCHVNASAQLDCEAKCNVSGGCDGGTLTARCSPGDLSGQCSGTCNASAYCEGSATVAAQCQGTCMGSCTGTCSGNCTGTCDGTCMGTCDGSTSNGTHCAGTCSGTCSTTCHGSCDVGCKGTCNGECKLDANVNVNCGANVSCKGGCSVAYTAPECEAKLTPLMCNVNANCEAGCTGQASFQATCDPPKIVVELDASASASLTTLQTTLQADLPAIYQVIAQSKLVADAAGSVVTSAGDVGTAITASLGCLAKYGAGFVANLSAAAQASASVSVSVKASASVSGSASGSSS